MRNVRGTSEPLICIFPRNSRKFSTQIWLFYFQKSSLLYFLYLSDNEINREYCDSVSLRMIFLKHFRAFFFTMTFLLLILGCFPAYWQVDKYFRFPSMNDIILWVFIDFYFNNPTLTMKYLQNYWTPYHQPTIRFVKTPNIISIVTYITLPTRMKKWWKKLKTTISPKLCTNWYIDLD